MVFGLFSKEKALKRAMDKVVNKHAQSVDRLDAMEKLRADGGAEALFALCKRFSFNYDKGSEDEQEKEWACDALIAKGEAALAPLRRYMKSAASVAYPLRVLEASARRETALEVIDELLKDEEPGYTRDPSKRIQIVHWLGEWRGGSDTDVVSRVTPYLADFDEPCRYAAVEAIALHVKAAPGGALLDALLRPEEESKRLRRRIAEVLAEAQIDLGERKSQVAPLLEDLLSGFQMHKDRLVPRKGK